MRPATTLTIALLCLLILGAAVVAFFVQPSNHNDLCSGSSRQTVSCEAPNTTVHQR